MTDTVAPVPERERSRLLGILELEAESVKEQEAEREAALAATARLTAENDVAFRAEWAAFWEEVRPLVPLQLEAFLVLPDPDTAPTERLMKTARDVALVFKIPGHENFLARFRRKFGKVADTFLPWYLEKWEVNDLTTWYNEGGSGYIGEGNNHEDFEPERWVLACVKAKKLFDEERPRLLEIIQQQDAENKARAADLATHPEGHYRPTAGEIKLLQALREVRNEPADWEY